MTRKELCSLSDPAQLVLFPLSTSTQGLTGSPGAQKATTMVENYEGSQKSSRKTRSPKERGNGTSA